MADCAVFNLDYDSYSLFNQTSRLVPNSQSRCRLPLQSPRPGGGLTGVKGPQVVVKSPV